MRINKWIAIVTALLCILHAAAVHAETETHHRFMLQKSIELSETLQKMAASKGFLSLFARNSPDTTELAARIAILDFGKPDAAVIIMVPKESLDLTLKLMIAPLMKENPSFDFSLFDDATIKERMMEQIPQIVPNALLTSQGVDWVVLSNALTYSGMDDLPEGLSSHAFAAFAFREERMIYLVSFTPNERWQFVSYYARLMPYDPDLGMDTIQKLIDTMLPGYGKLISSSLQTTTFTGKEISDLRLHDINRRK